MGSDKRETSTRIRRHERMHAGTGWGRDSPAARGKSPLSRLCRTYRVSVPVSHVLSGAGIASLRAVYGLTTELSRVPLIALVRVAAVWGLAACELVPGLSRRPLRPHPELVRRAGDAGLDAARAALIARADVEAM